MAPTRPGARLRVSVKPRTGVGQMVGIVFLYGVWAAIVIGSIVAVMMMLKEQ